MALSRMSDQIGRVLDGRYRLVAPIGTGASGRVYLADDVRLRRRVAVKVLHPSLADDEAFLRRFQAEAHAVAALNHPHVMAVYDWGRDDLPYLVTEYLGGGSLRGLLDTGRRLTLSQALLVGLEATRGLDYAHRRGFVHRDIKPANLLFGEDGRLRIADFGLARALAEAAWTEPSGAVLGTARYASPEQAQGRSVDGRSDVYALALTLVEGVTGQVPFAADTTIATLMARVDQPLELDAGFGPLRSVLERAGAPDPVDRPDAGELAVYLMAAAEDLARPEPLPLAGAVAGPVESAPVGELTELGAADAAGVETVAVPVVGSDDAEVRDEPPSRRAARRAARRRRRADRRSELEAGTRRRRRWPVVLAVLVVLAGLGAGGAVAWVQTRTPIHDVDSFLGLQAAEVPALVAEFDWVVTELQDRRDGTVPGEVIDQLPAPGERLEQGGELVITVSLGNTRVAIPEGLVGLPLDEAEARLVAAELVLGAVGEEFSEQVGAGVVLAVIGDDAVPKGDPVDLVVSLGPEPRVVPVLDGGTFADAEAELAALGLVAVRAEESSRTVPEGQVVRTEPGPGEQVERGVEITVVISTGLPFVRVPDVTGRSAGEAANLLEDAGFTIRDTQGPPNRPVLVTDPPAGELHREGTAILIITRQT